MKSDEKENMEISVQSVRWIALFYYVRNIVPIFQEYPRKSTAKNLIDEADFLMRGMLGLGNIAMRYFLE